MIVFMYLRIYGSIPIDFLGSMVNFYSVGRKKKGKQREYLRINV